MADAANAALGHPGGVRRFHSNLHTGMDTFHQHPVLTFEYNEVGFDVEVRRGLHLLQLRKRTAPVDVLLAAPANCLPKLVTS